MTTPLVLGADAGGTTTRAVVATLDGRIVGRGRSDAGNPVAVDPVEAAAALGAAIGSALTGHDPSRVVGGVVGLAGVSRLADPSVGAVYAGHWSRLGLSCPVRPVGDALVAFAAGTPANTGTVLIAGTGAVAAVLHEGNIIRIADGLGWLLGDEGSGYWLGLAAVKATARALYRGTPPRDGSLGGAVCAQVGTTEPDTFVTRIYQLSRDRVAAIAPAVARTARDGDPDARHILRTAAHRLADTLVSLHPAPGPVVLAGGVLGGVPEIRENVQRQLADRLGQPGVIAGDGAAGAAWLATRLVEPRAGNGIHARLVSPG
ncbi:N-acetylglucosamine kinase-like BadF-type ATPase [Micromonospora pisi]|uniref:N-acetylglucosamine kinase-like BadF-type ATPase n=1 Tax=Micromonospora pisi TaxID=589240 RepID=A0A495JSW4_9ACTN|nr:BadF/BadG/BcrA/BcrD ATPase family protein [Micromonospora pisi]RKR92076.1 N-acetylglucosamine kinase-like BadF-type ATPase [Micromonospora pisi]